jgi:D-amino-acid dehydrogenase
LNASNDTASAIYFPNDLVGNCRQFAQLLKDRAAAAGTRFEFNTAVTYVNCTPRVELSLQGTSQAVQFDKVVLCTGEALEGLAAPLKIKIPLMTAHAYSLSAQLREPLNGPRSAVYDAKTRIGITRIGNRIRATGGAQIGHPTIASGKRTQERLYLAIQSSFPGAATLSNSTQFWHASTLVATDSKPVIGETEVPGIYLNVGHGFNGWGMSCGSARLLADELSQQTQPLHTTTFSPKRFKR